MAWRIHSWSAATRTGEIVSPHFGPWSFGPEQNPEGTADFAVDEEVLVELDGDKEDYRVRSVVRARHRADEMPAGTSCAIFERVNSARLPDMMIEERTDTELRLWVGSCCRWCGDSWGVRFSGVTSFRGLDDDTGLDEPIFRYATEAEVRSEGLEVPAGARAYRIIATSYADGPRADPVFVVADSVEVESLPAAR